MALNFRVHGRWVLVRVDHLVDRREDESGHVTKPFVLEFPHTLHHYVCRADRGSDQPAGSPGALHLDVFAHVTHQYAVEAAIQPAKARTTRRLAKCCFDDVPVQPELISRIESTVNVTDT